MPSCAVRGSGRRVWIEGGVYKERRPVPGMPRLVEELGVAQNTIRKVVNRLKAEGLVGAVDGKGRISPLAKASDATRVPLLLIPFGPAAPTGSPFPAVYVILIAFDRKDKRQFHISKLL
ncbi:MAG: GntR family transcriptional regulator [Thermobispora bispora]|nr:GntR family transcriptional regulator [Thermobispora bispora]